MVILCDPPEHTFLSNVRASRFRRNLSRALRLLAVASAARDCGPSCDSMLSLSEGLCLLETSFKCHDPCPLAFAAALEQPASILLRQR